MKHRAKKDWAGKTELPVTKHDTQDRTSIELEIFEHCVRFGSEEHGHRFRQFFDTTSTASLRQITVQFRPVTGNQVFVVSLYGPASVNTCVSEALISVSALESVTIPISTSSAQIPKLFLSRVLLSARAASCCCDTVLCVDLRCPLGSDLVA